MVLYEIMCILDFGRNFYGYLFCSISRVLLGIHPNPRFVGDWVEKPYFVSNGYGILHIFMV